MINGNKCEHCGSDVGIFVLNTNAGGTVGTSKKIVKCIGCNEVILSRPTNEQLEVL